MAGDRLWRWLPLAGLGLFALWPRRARGGAMTGQPDYAAQIPGAPHFTWREFASRHYVFSAEALENVPKVAAVLEVIRAEAGHRPVTVHSGYRDKRHNDAVSGSPNSQHLRGKAADITIRGMSPDQVADLIDQLQRSGRIPAGGLGRYQTFTHVDIRGSLARWDERPFS